MVELTPATDLAVTNSTRHPNESNAYREACQELLVEEIELRRHGERVAELRRHLPPGGEVPADYSFVGEDGADVRLSELFGDHDTLVVYSYMFGSERESPCPMRTSLMGGFDHKIADIGQRVAIAFTARSPIERQIEANVYAGGRSCRCTSIAATTTRGRLCPPMTTTRRDTTCSHGATARSATSGETRSPSTWPTPIRIRAVRSRWTPLWQFLYTVPAGRSIDWHPSLTYESS